jgi:hypothetical protein
MGKTYCSISVCRFVSNTRRSPADDEMTMMMMLFLLLGSLVAAATTSSRHSQRHHHQVLAHPCGPSSSGGYPDLLLPTIINISSSSSSSHAPVTTVGHCDGDGGLAFVTPAVLNYVSPPIRQMSLLRDPTGRDVFLPSDVLLVGDDAGRGRDSTIDPSSSLSSPWDPRHVSVFNGREAKVGLDANGFELVQSPLSRSSTAPVDFDNPQEVSSSYYPACEALVREKFAALSGGGGAGRPVLVRAFDHNVRHADAPHKQEEEEGENDEAGGGSALPPAGIVHNDYTAVSAPRRLEQLASSAAHRNDVFMKASDHAIPAHLVQEALQGKRRYAFVNVWRSIDAINPVQSFPLALMDAQSAAVLSDLRLLQIHYVDRVGENYLAAFHKDHRWYYFPDMTMDEAILIKQWDSFGDLCHRRQPTAAVPASTTLPSHSLPAVDMSQSSVPSNVPAPRSTFALHTAFACRPRRTPTTTPPPPRKSIEVRCVCIWDEE